MAHAHRIGQTRYVCVYRLLTAKTYERHMFHSARLKLGIDRAVLANQRQNTEADGSIDGTSKKISKSKIEKWMQAKEIDELLKKGAYDVFQDDDDTEVQQLMGTGIDQLLERCSRTVTYCSSGHSTMSSGLGSFIKEFFSSTEDGYGQDLDLDDPDFWGNAVGIEAPHESTGEDGMKVISEKRIPKQEKVYDTYDEFSEVFTERAILLLSDGTDLNEIIRLF